ncbi:MAG: TonB family protein [Candidatus Korobacteraceae bacterium]
MHGTADIFAHHESWKNPLAWSLGLHLVLFVGMVLSGALGGRGESWGGSTSGGGAMSATLVSSIPLPAAPVQTENILANQSKGLSQSLPAEKAAQPEPEAVPIPDSRAKVVPAPTQKAVEQPQPVKPAPTQTANARPARPNQPEPPPDVVPIGQGGPVSGPYGAFTADNAKGGFGFTGSGGDFGNRFAWYVDSVRRKVSENWLKYEVDPNIHEAKRVFITFDITRSGQPTNVQLSQPSGISSLDVSAVRAIQRIDTFGPLPREYPGSRVSVEFWFDYRR